MVFKYRITRYHRDYPAGMDQGIDDLRLWVHGDAIPVWQSA
jgi:hypothetical protein